MAVEEVSVGKNNEWMKYMTGLVNNHHPIIGGLWKENKTQYFTKFSFVPLQANYNTNKLKHE